MYVIYTKWGYSIHHDGMVSYTRDPRHATKFRTKDEALRRRPGHPYEMGGSGLHGEALSYMEACRLARVSP